MIFLFDGDSKKQERIGLEEDTDVTIKNGIEAEVSGSGVLVLALLAICDHLSIPPFLKDLFLYRYHFHTF